MAIGKNCSCYFIVISISTYPRSLAPTERFCGDPQRRRRDGRTEIRYLLLFRGQCFREGCRVGLP